MGIDIDALPASQWMGLDLAHDDIGEPPLPADVVLGPSATTTLLAHITARRPCRRALDLATGCGALAILAAAHADQVVATDVNPRALALTELNARRNTCDRVEVRQGDLYEPVLGERFDLITGNLPFVLSPDAEYIFRDGLDQRRPGSKTIVDRALFGVGEMLEPGGIAQFLANWPVGDLQRAEQVGVEWLHASGLGGLVVTHGVQTLESYVNRWTAAEFTGPLTPEARHAMVDRWVGHLESMGAAAVANGVIVAHHTADRSIRLARARVRSAGAGGEQVRRILTAPNLDDAALLASRPRMAAPWTVHSTAGVGGALVTDPMIQIVLGDTCGVIGHVPDSLVPLLRVLDGVLSVHEARQAAHMSMPELHELLSTLRRLTATGLLHFD